MAGHSLDFRNVNALWSSVLVETLVRSGVTHAVISPGSRSTPLTIALARHPGIAATPVLDERSAAFFALGLAKASGNPVVLVCTSGTATANYFPAVIEAHESGVPLLVLTADRPPELRASASGQTIDQQKIYGDYVRHYHELAVPAADPALLRYLRQTVTHAVARTLGAGGGPVHLNASFRDPLPPISDGGVAERAVAGIDWPEFFSQVAPPRFTATVLAGGALPTGARGLIVVGPAQPKNIEEFVDAVGAIARRLGWPVLAEGLSPLRHHAARVPQLVTTYDTILRNAAVAGQLKPDAVLCLGGWPTSKVLRAWLEECDAPTWLATERLDNRDALHLRTQTLPVSLPVLAAVLPASTAPGDYAARWARGEQLARTGLDQRLRAETGLFEAKAAWLLAQYLPARTPFFISNSMPIRDVEYVTPATDRALRPLCNRGANGIDGTLSTALGVAQAADRPAVLLTGDLALLHDTNGFLIAPKFRGALTIVLIDNHGGGIFGHLPVAQFDPPFEEFFATPQAVDFGRLCAAYPDIDYTLISDWEAFTRAIATLPARGIRVLHLRTDRAADAGRRKQLFAEVAAAVG